MPVKIEPKSPYEMAYSDVKEELTMRLHDAALMFSADRHFETANMLFHAEKLVKDADFVEARKACIDELFELSTVNSESSTRIHALFNYLENWKKDPANGSLALATNERFELIQAEVVDEFGMSQSQVERLTQLEFAIQKGIDGFKAAGEALSEIRDSGLYREYGTFEQYCEVKWGFSRSRAYQFIEAEKTVNKLLTAGIDSTELPENEAQARALAAVPPEKQAEVWTQARVGGKPSAARIKAIASALTPSSSPSGGEGGKSDPDGMASLTQEESKEFETCWNSNLWETPTNIARQIAHLLNHDEGKILECAIGSGQIAQELMVYANVVSLTGVEILKDRADRARQRPSLKNCKILNQDFLQMNPKRSFDAVVTNPPFEWGMDFIHHSLKFIKPEGRLLFVLPIAFFCAKERGFRFQGMDAHIHKVYPVIGRIPYLKEGVAETGRQCDDAIFDIRLGKDGACMEFICQ